MCCLWGNNMEYRDRDCSICGRTLESNELDICFDCETEQRDYIDFGKGDHY